MGVPILVDPCCPIAISINSFADDSILVISTNSRDDFLGYWSFGGKINNNLIA